MTLLTTWTAPSGKIFQLTRITASTLTSFLNHQLVKTVSLGLILSLLVFPSPLWGAKEPPAHLKNMDPTSFKQYASISVEKTFELSTDTSTIRFLLTHLDFTCAIIRGWNLESFQARQLGPGYYRARDGVGLNGLISQISNHDTAVVFGGAGRFATSHLPVTLRGRALAEISFLPINDNKSRVTGTLHVRINNVLIHLMSQVFYPVVSRLANNKSEHLIKVAKKTIMKMNSYPRGTKQRLSSIDPEYVKLWKRLRQPDE